MRFRTALVLGVLPLAAITLTATVLAAAVVLERAARREASDDLARTRAVYADLEDYRLQLLRAESPGSADEPRLRALAAKELDDRVAEAMRRQAGGVVESARRLVHVLYAVLAV